MKCNICDENFDPANLSQVVEHEHTGLDTSKVQGIKGTKMNEAEKGVLSAVPDKSWKCGCCGKVAPWGSTWQWYGSLKDLDYSGRDKITVVCSETCKKKVAVQADG